MSKKRCVRCKKKRALSKFRQRPDFNGTDSYCRDCRSAYSKEHYQANKELHNKRRYSNERTRRKGLRKLVREAKNKPCSDCGNEHPYFVMDMDHLDPRTKKFDLGNPWNHTEEAVKAEIAKCEVVCANCHRYRTFGE